MSLGLHCLESLTAISFGCYAVATGDLGTMAGGAVAGTTLLRLWSEHRNKRPLDSERALTKAREAVAKDFAAWAKAEGVSAADIRAADLAMKQHLADCIPDKETLGGLVISDQRYPKSAARYVVDKLAKRDSLFCPEGIPRDFALTVVESALRSALGDEEYTRELQVYMLTAMGEAIHEVRAGMREANHKLDLLVSQFANMAAKNAINEEALISLARQVANNVDDVETAKRELARAITLFLEIRDRAPQGSNLGNLIDETMRRISALNDQGKFAEGAAEAERAYDTIQARKDDLNAAELRAIDAAIDQYRLAYDAQGAARWIEKRIVAETGQLNLDTLFDEIKPLYGEAERCGLRLEGDIAYRIALRAVDLVSEREDQWAALVGLGVAASFQGERLGGVEGATKQEKAVKAYRAALRVYTEAELPAAWAATLNWLGTALRNQGERLGGAEGMAKLEESVTIHREAMRVHAEADPALDWLEMQNNLGIALAAQGARLGGAEGVARLEEAVTAYRTALCVCTEADQPYYWAKTQNNLGVALAAQAVSLGGAEGAARLEEAVTASYAALEVRTEAELPADWAATQNNLGNAIRMQGVRLGGAAGAVKLEEAVMAYRAALRVRTEADLPADWAMTRKNMAVAFNALADAETDRAAGHLHEAEAAVLDALRVYDPEHMPFDHGTATRLLTDIRARLADLAP